MKRFKVDGHTIEIEHDQKVLFPKDCITKSDLALYYEKIAPSMLPYLAHRQLTMQRYPEGIEKEGFYQKDIPDYFPSWIKRACSQKKSGEEICYLMADSAAALVYMVSQNAIVCHISLSKVDKPDYPDRIIFDLDPSDDDWKKVVKAAYILKDILEDELFLKTFVMTTGSRGVHIVIPLNRRADFVATKAFSRSVAELAEKRYPALLTTEVRKEKRGKRVFIDYLRNAYGQTGVAPYSVRARLGAPIATPLTWEELKSLKAADAYTITSILKRLAQKDDPWKGIDKHGQSLSKALEIMKKMNV